MVDSATRDRPVTEITPAMIQAGKSAFHGFEWLFQPGARGHAANMVTAVYTAMLAAREAAPKAPIETSR